MISGTFEEALKNPSEMALSEREANFLKRDLQIHGLASYDPPKPPYNVGVWRLSNLGFELVRYETELAAKARVDLFARISSYRAAETMKTLTEFLDKPGLSQEVCNRPQAAAL
jgi:hypothetical protein